jgi:FKBP-type peptidyl-prolyl cis-trans isomerase
MNSKYIIISVIVVIVVLVGGYGLYALMKSDATATEQNGQAANTDQVQAQEVTIGTGTEAVPGATVSVLYVGQLQDGTVFDSSEAHGNVPLTFVLGDQGMIPGFQIGVNGMRVGGERLMAIPPSLAYGNQDVTDENGNVVIPANSTIVFDVKLVDVQLPQGVDAATDSATQ